MVLRAKLNKARQIALHYPTALLTAPRVLVKDPSDVLVATIDMTASTTAGDLYLSDTNFTPTEIGEYTLFFEDDPGGGYADVDHGTLMVGVDPVSDFVLSASAAQTFIISENDVGDTTSTVTLKILTEADALQEPTISATYDATVAGYKATVVTPINTQAAYYLVWYDDGVLEDVKILYAVTPKDTELVEISVFDSTNLSTPYTNATVLFSTEAGVAIAQAITNSKGVATVEVAAKDYIVSLTKTGITFSKNNFKVTVYDTAQSTIVVSSGIIEDTKLKVAAAGTLFTSASPVVNKFSLDVESFAATWTTFTPPTGVCKLFANLVRFDGTPMANTDVLISLRQGPETYSGVGAFGTSKIVQTDSNGYVEFDLLQGIVVEIAIMTHSLRRTITVPSSAGPTNLLTLLSAASDPFDVVVVNTQDAPRRAI